MSLAEYLRSLKPAQRAQLAAAVERHEGYLYLVSGGHRRASPELAIAIEKASGGVVMRSELRPDLWERAA